MSMIHRMCSFAAGAALVGAAQGAPAAGPAPLPAEQAAALLGCGIPLAVAHDNLVARGYVIEQSGDGRFSTRFRMSERDSTRRLFGSLAVERARQYEVAAVDAGIRFVPRYRETVYATGALGNNRDQTREYAVALDVAQADTLKDMQNEVCGPLAVKPAGGDAAPDSDVQRYLQDSCKAGDARACKLLPAR